MKSNLTLFIILLLAPFCLQAAPISDVSSSALMPGDSAIFNLDFIDPFGLPLYDIMIKARPNGAASDSTVILSHVDADPRYLNTYEGIMRFSNPSGPIQFYGRVASDTIVITQSYLNTSNQFPPQSILYAPLAPDAVGDTVNGAAGAWLDLTGCDVTYSDDKLYVRLDNVSSTWPTSQGFFTYFIYAAYLYNPDTLGLTATAMVYGNVPLILTPGLYHVNLADTTFERIADINSTVSGGKLHLACETSDLNTDPNFPTWPPQSGHVIIGGFTLTINLSTPNFNDYSYPSSFIPETQFLNTTSLPPDIFNPNFEIIPGVTVNVTCDYYDPDNNLPVVSQLLFDRGVFEMGAFDHSYGDTAAFNHLLAWPGDGEHVYYFRFSDGVTTIETPMDTVNLSSDGIIEAPLPELAELLQNYPNPFNAQTQISFNLSSPGPASLSIYDINGNSVTTLVDDYLNAGSHSITWDGTNSSGQPVSSGIYFYQLDTASNGNITRRMVLLK